MPSPTHIFVRDLLAVLKHTAPLEGVSIRSDGYVNVEDIWRLPRFRNAERPDLSALVATRRADLELMQEADATGTRSTLYIRARSGHTIRNVVADMVELIDPATMEVVIHRTSPSAWKSIARDGLRPSRGPYMQFESGGHDLGCTGHATVLLRLEVEQAAAAGIPFYLTHDGHILSPGNANGRIPPEFLTSVQSTTAGFVAADVPQTVSRTNKRRFRRSKKSTVDGIANQGAESSRRWLRCYVSQSSTQRRIYERAHHAPDEVGSSYGSDESVDAPGPATPSSRHYTAAYESYGLRTASYEDDVFVQHVSFDSTDVFGAREASQHPWTQEEGADAFEALHSTQPKHCCPSLSNSTSAPARRDHHVLSDVESDDSSSETSHAKDPSGLPLPSEPMGLAAYSSSHLLHQASWLSTAHETVGSPRRLSRTNWVIMPVAIPGCGRTGIAAALSHVLGFAYVEAKSAKSSGVFLRSVQGSLRQNDIVVADRNHHKRHHRQGLLNAVDALGTSVNVVALKWTLHSPSPAAVHKQCRTRIMSWKRGHRWFNAGKDETLDKMLWKFLREADPLAEDEYDAVIHMDPFEDLEAGLVRAIQGLVDILGCAPPAAEKVAEAINVARAVRV